MTRMTFEEFSRLAKSHKTIPVYQKILADLLTPISAYMRLFKHSDYGFLLESVEKGTRYSRYSFMGIHPKMILSHNCGQSTVHANGQTYKIDKPFFEILRETLQNYSCPQLEGLPPFSGGWVGYLGYETITWLENIPVHSKDRINIPDALFLLFEELIAFDHLKNQVVVFCNVNVDKEKNLKRLYNHAHRRIDQLGQALHTDINYQTPAKKVKQSRFPGTNMSQKAFEDIVKKAKTYIKAGDILQIVLSQRFHRQTSADPDSLYRALRTINPSPYMFHLKLKDLDIIGASPELLVKVENSIVEIRPIAGTRKRGSNEDEDKMLSEDLLSDEKERAEHLMLVDMARNDVGRVAEFGSVKVKQFMETERYSHVIHIVSDVQGKLQKDKTVFDALMNGFPAGTTTGAPKIRAMELIHLLEPTRRGVYSGAIGYIDFSGNLNTCIAIRTLIMKNKTVYFQAGAGIVYDSDPTREYQETINKAKAIMSAIDLAENGLVSLIPNPNQGNSRLKTEQL